VRALHQVDLDRLERQLEQAQQRLDAMRVAGQGMAVEADGLAGAGHGLLLRSIRWPDLAPIRVLKEYL